MPDATRAPVRHVRPTNIMALPDDLLHRIALQLDFDTRRRVLPQICKPWREFVDSIDNWNDCRISFLHPPQRHFKQTRVLRWFYKHRSSISSLRLECLHSEDTIAGLRDSFIPVLFGILSTTLKRLVVNSCENVLPSSRLSEIASLRGLRHLRMHLRQPISSRQLGDALQYLPNLRVLVVTIVHVTGEDKQETLNSATLRLRRTLDSTLPSLTKLKQIEISLSMWPSEVADGRGLLPHLPHLPSEPPRLQHVQLSRMGASSWPADWFDSLGCCTNLILSSNILGCAVLPPISSCNVLQRLDLSMNMLRQLPPGLCHCQHLVELHLDANMLTEAAFPDEFSALTRLTLLQLDNNRLEQIPASCLQLPLQNWSLECNPVTHLPGGKYLNTLEHLCLSHTHLEELPSVLSAATRLVYLDISENVFMMSAHELQWLSASLQRNSHLPFSGLKFGTEFPMDNCIGCRPDLEQEDNLQLGAVLGGAEPHLPVQPHVNEASDSEPFAQFADLGQSSSDEDEVMAAYGG